jgi:hypothetical protein
VNRFMDGTTNAQEQRAQSGIDVSTTTCQGGCGSTIPASLE